MVCVLMQAREAAGTQAQRTQSGTVLVSNAVMYAGTLLSSTACEHMPLWQGTYLEMIFNVSEAMKCAWLSCKAGCASYELYIWCVL